MNKKDLKQWRKVYKEVTSRARTATPAELNSVQAPVTKEFKFVWGEEDEFGEILWESTIISDSAAEAYVSWSSGDPYEKKQVALKDVFIMTEIRKEGNDE